MEVKAAAETISSRTTFGLQNAYMKAFKIREGVPESK